jgi:hypothetical protein
VHNTRRSFLLQMQEGLMAPSELDLNRTPSLMKWTPVWGALPLYEWQLIFTYITLFANVIHVSGGWNLRVDMPFAGADLQVLLPLQKLCCRVHYEDRS